MSKLREDVLAAWIHDTKHAYLLDRESIADSVDGVIAVIREHIAHEIAQAREEFILSSFSKDDPWDRGFYDGLTFGDQCVAGKGPKMTATRPTGELTATA